MTHDEILAAYAAKNGLADCRFDAGGLAVFELGDGLAVYVESHPNRNVLLLQTAVPVENGVSREFAGDLLGSNLFYRGQKSPVAAYDAAAGEIVLLAGLDTRTLGVEDFEDCLGELIESAEYWRSARQTSQNYMPSPDAPPPGQDIAARV